ncbi:BTAD domain-containing putative transcriptional regulator [Streptomyces sp. NPDC052299]|uniref:AfsR/SARP family transcriptional regulator n=1 Tax=Streptomyces sp. NPDC052299 TaxID=3155054 RepID=UPI003412BDD3
MRYGILGSLEVSDGDRPVGVDRPRRRAVLAFLLLHANRSVTTEQLVDALWEQDPPASARGQVHTAVSELRRILGASGDAPLTSHHGTYRLTVAARALDADEFASRLDEAGRLAGAGESGEAARTVRDGLGLWRGAALADITAPFAGPARMRLEEQRFAAHELLADIELGRGRHRELVPELTAVLAIHPAREGIAERLMLALYRSGRQTDALAVARSVRALLVDEFGLDPGRSLVELEQAVLRGDPALVAPGGGSDVAGAGRAGGPAVLTGPGAGGGPEPAPSAAPSPAAPSAAPGGPATPAVGLSWSDLWGKAPRPAQLPPYTAGFIGRDEQLAALDAVREQEFGVPRVALVTGPAGVGKTALVVRWAHQRAEEFPDGQLFVDLRGYAEGDCEEPGTVLERFLIALGVPAPQIPASTAAREDLYRSCLAGRRVLVVLDNARDYRRIRPLLPGSAGCLTLVTSRNMLGTLLVESGAAAVRVDSLRPERAVEVLGRVVGPGRIAAEPDAARELARLCGELPLALRIAAARLLEGGMLLAELVAELATDSDRLGALELPGDDSSAVGRALDHTYRHLRADLARAFRLQGVHPGQWLGPAAAAALTHTGPVLPARAAGANRRLLRELETVHLVERQGPSRYALHDLVRLYARSRADGDPAERDAALGRLYDWYIGVSKAGERLLDPGRADLGVQVVYPLDDPAPLADYAAALSWFEEESENLLALLRLAVERGDHRVVWQLADHHFGYLLRSHRLDALTECAQRGEDAARAIGNEHAAARMANGLGVVHSLRRELEPATAAYERALGFYERTGMQRPALATRANLGSLHYDLGRLAEARAYQESALAAARVLDDPRLLTVSLANLGITLADLHEHSAAEALVGEALEVMAARRPGEPSYVFRSNLARVRHRGGRYEQAARDARDALAEARRLGDALHTGQILHQLGETLAASGQPDQARAHWQDALEVFLECGSPDAEKVRALLA